MTYFTGARFNPDWQELESPEAKTDRGRGRPSRNHHPPETLAGRVLCRTHATTSVLMLSDFQKT